MLIKSLVRKPDKIKGDKRRTKPGYYKTIYAGGAAQR